MAQQLPAAAEQQQLFPRLDQYRQQALGEKTLSLFNLDKSQSEVRIYIQRLMDSDIRKSERWQADNTEKEFYSDSSGKSGGQKEKLAYTILASALVYQFGLEWKVTKSRSFRFVLIDEAFGRGSDESARYGFAN